MTKTAVLAFMLMLLSLVISPTGARGDNQAHDLITESHATAFVSALTESDILGLEEIHEENQGQDLQAKLDHLFHRENPPPAPGTRVKLIKIENKKLKPSAGKNPAPALTESSFHFEMSFPSGARHLALLVIRQSPDGKTGFSLLAHPVGGGAPTNGGFPLKGKPISQLLFLVLGFGVAIFILVMAFVCFRLKPRGRWFWIVFILIGYTRMDMNWATGTVRFLPFQLTLFGFQIQKSQGHWWVSVALPLGALYFYWFKVRNRYLTTKR